MSQESTGTAPFRILVPYDGSPQAKRALDYAATLPASELILLHVQTEGLMGIADSAPGGFSVLPASAPGGYRLLPSTPEQGDAETIALRSELESIVAPLRTAERSVGAEVRYGDVAEEIINAASTRDLVVMSTHGRSAAGRILFGSIADRVSRYSPTPTVLIRKEEEGEELSAPGRIVVPLDGSEIAERALPLAISLADALSVPLHLVRAVGLDEVRATIHAKRSSEVASTSADTDADATYEDARQETERLATEYLEGLAGDIEAQGIDVQTGVLDGTAAFVLIWELEADDLLVMTSHGRSGFRRWLLGSVAEKLVREAKAPVLLVPTRNASS